ncbi:hypothetical protein PJ311_16250 [Bacillus sp. CLL-7-23]|uniref:IS1 family transposase n=1 Tax=Bacillus changyiensis TaxID=3004103 RepID=A0ABT4X782_9BACI|nr:hypothetical protein [Bacillus changyiensis]MDA7028126.1 hypothetical protein [Bacillus changyiensis]
MTKQTKKAKCPFCGSDKLTKKKRGWTLTTGIYGMNNMRYKCHDCGKKFMEHKADFS